MTTPVSSMRTCWVRRAVSAAASPGGARPRPGRWCPASSSRRGRPRGPRPRCGRCCCPAAGRSARRPPSGCGSAATGPLVTWRRRRRAATRPRSAGRRGTWRSPRRSRCRVEEPEVSNERERAITPRSPPPTCRSPRRSRRPRSPSSPRPWPRPSLHPVRYAQRPSRPPRS